MVPLMYRYNKENAIRLIDTSIDTKASSQQAGI